MSLTIGTILRGRYQITSRLGGGGFAETYLAEDRDIKSQPLCVVKKLKPLLIDPHSLAIATRLFQTESEVLYKLKHPCIPRLLADFTEQGEFYLIQEYIDGDDLSKTELAAGTVIAESQLINLLRDILEVLAFVHQQNVIHRDIKPSNLIRDRQSGKLFLIDFGAVKQIEKVATQSLQHTVPIGTAGYMPSEQAGGFPVPASDIYAVGALAIQALTGILPHQFSRDTNNREILWRNNVKVTPKLAAIIDKMVRYNAPQRYPSAVEALAAIESLSPQKKAFAPLAYLGMGGAIALLAGIGFYSFNQSQTKLPLAEYSWKAPNSTYTINLKYPENWTIESGAYPSTPDIDTLVFPKSNHPDNVIPEITINTEPLDKPILLQEYTQELITRLKQRFSNLQLSPKCEDDLILSGNSTKTICYKVREENINIKYLVAVTMHSDRAYYLVYKAEENQYARSLMSVKAVFRTFKIIEQ